MSRARPTSEILNRLENLNGSDINNDLNWTDEVQAAAAAPVQDILAGAGIGVTKDPATRQYLITNTGGGGGNGTAVQSDWQEANALSLAYIKNKPTDLNEFQNGPGYITASQVPVQELVAGTDITIVENPGKSFTINAVRQPQVQSDWDETSSGSSAYIKNKPTQVSEFTNDSGYLTLSTTPVKDIVAGANTKVVNSGGTYTISAIVDNATQSQSDWAETDNQSISYIKNKPDIPENTSDLVNDSGYINLSQAAGAAPVQDILAGKNITVSQANGIYTINADASNSSGFVSSLNGLNGTISLVDAGNVSISPAGQNISLSVDLPVNTSDLTNDGDGSGGGLFVDYAALSTELADYLPLAGGTMTGDIAWDTGAKIGDPAANTFAISTAGTERLRVGTTYVDIKLPSASTSLTGIRLFDDLGAASGFAYQYSTTYVGGIVMGMPKGSTIFGNKTDVGLLTTTDVPVWIGVNGQTVAKFFSTESVFYQPAQYGAAGGTSASNPAIRFAGSPMAGFYAPLTDTVAISTAGVERLRVDGEGSVAIGTTTQAGRQLRVQYRVDGTETVAVASQLDVNVPTGSEVNTAFGCQLQQVGGGTVKGRAVGYYVSDTGLHASAPTRYGIQTSIAKNASNETFAIHCTGTAPAYFGGQVQCSPGNSAEPSVAFIGDTDTGIYSPSANTFAISTAGIERMRVGSIGNVGVGTSPSASTALSVDFNWTEIGSGSVIIVSGSGKPSTTCTSVQCFRAAATIQSPGATVYGYNVAPTAVTGNGTVQSHLGFHCNDLTAGTTVHAFRGRVNQRGGASCYNLYMDGNAPNYLRGNLHVDGTAWLTLGASTGGSYTPTNPQDLATKAYVDTAAVDLTNVPDGTPATPAIAFANDKATGIFRETATNCWCVSVGGSKRFEIDTVGDCYTSGWLGVATPDDATSPLDINGDRIRIRGSLSLSSETDPGNAGDLGWDDSYLYLRTSTVWKKIPLAAYSTAGGASVTVQMTQAQYDALAVKDPSTLYVIVG